MGLQAGNSAHDRQAAECSSDLQVVLKKLLLLIRGRKLIGAGADHNIIYLHCGGPGYSRPFFIGIHLIWVGVDERQSRRLDRDLGQGIYF
jgi:hypothetical protein